MKNDFFIYIFSVKWRRSNNIKSNGDKILSCKSFRKIFHLGSFRTNGETFFEIYLLIFFRDYISVYFYEIFSVRLLIR